MVEVAEDLLPARSISCAGCEHGSVFLRLHDAQGVVFAVAVMPAETAAEFADQLAETAGETARIESASDPIGECVGHG